MLRNQHRRTKYEDKSDSSDIFSVKSLSKIVLVDVSVDDVK